MFVVVDSVYSRLIDGVLLLLLMSLLLLLLRLVVTNVVAAVVVQRRRGGCFLSELVMAEGALYGYFAKIWVLQPSGGALLES